MLATTMYFLKGTPFIYQGQEIGMTNMQINSLDDYVDIETKDVLKTMHKLPLTTKYKTKSIMNGSRDNARVPMHWNDSEYAGFSNTKPWLKVNENKSFINVEQAKNDPNSIYNYYKKLIQIHKEYDLVKEGKYKDLLPKHKYLYAYERKLDNKLLLVISNFSEKTNKCKILEKYKDYKQNVLLNNYEQIVEGKLLPYQSILLFLEK